VDPGPGWVKQNTMRLLFAVSPLNTYHSGISAKTGCLGIKSR